MALTQALAQVQGFRDGGLFQGRGGPRSDSNLIAVSDGEFIVNAAATRRNLSTLEAINSGQPVSTAQGAPNVTIEDRVGARFDVQRSGNNLRIIAREEAARVMQEEFGQTMATELGNPNSRSRKAMQDNYEVRPVR